MNTFSSVSSLRLRSAALTIALCGAVLLPGCTSLPDDPEERAEIKALNDPLEPMNRSIFSFNRALDTILLRPLAEAYDAVLPVTGQDMVKHFLDNLKSPVILANDLMQGEPDRAGETLTRFAANTSIGILGLFDVSEIEYHNEDFGQTMATWGVGEGPYLVLPFLGPSNIRDGVGIVADYHIDPFTWYTNNTGQEYLRWVRLGVRAVDTRARNIKTLDEIERSAIDLYATYRSFYRQYRKKEILNGREGPSVPMPQISMDMDDEDFDDDEAEDKTSLLKTD